MKINTALILCAGLGRRLNPLTLTKPKPLLELDKVTILERCINIIIKLGANKIFLNTFHLGKQINQFIENKKFPIDIQIIEDGKEILDTGGGILNMIENSEDKDFIVFNPDTLWHKNYSDEISKMQDFYFSKKLDNILLLANKNLSFDKNLKGDFNLKKNSLEKNISNDFIYIGCQILSRSLFKNYQVLNFSISTIWNELLKKDKLNGFESYNRFYHLTSLETFRKLKDL
tara:strand:- start:638 stop:1327 length:690 start_codon:yes stop_codon:yes gene_type:complete